jgi:hypothetical protein
VGLKQLQPWRVSIAINGRPVGLVELKSVDGDEAEFGVYQGEPIRIAWSKLPSAAQKAFENDRLLLLSGPEVPIEQTLKRMHASGITGRIVQKLQDGILVRLGTPGPRTSFILYNGTTPVKIPSAKVDFAGPEGDLVVIQNLPNETTLAFDDVINVVAFAQGTMQYGSQTVPLFTAAPLAAK